MRKPWNQLKARDLMRSPVIALDTETPLGEAARTLSEHQISGALVTDHRGAAVGVVSLFDIVTYLAGLERPPGEPGGFYRMGHPDFAEEEGAGDEPSEPTEDDELRTVTVGEIMSPEIFSIPPETPAVEVARILSERRIHRVFVSDARGPLGIISTLDVLGAVAGLRSARASA
jgi:CBS domain-containing protein